MALHGSLLGNAVRRVEDPDILFGRARYVDDLDIPGVLHLVFVRSTVAHAELRAVDTADAAGMPGVAGVFSAGDLDVPTAAGLMVVNPDFARPPLAKGKVRFVGDIVAVVGAESRAAAVDAAEQVVVDYEPLPAVVDPEAATEPGAPLQFEALGTNIAAGSREAGDDDPLAGADVVVRGRFENQRMAVLPMEGNAIAVVPGDDGAGHDLTVYVATQMPHGWRNQASEMFGLDPARLRRRAGRMDHQAHGPGALPDPPDRVRRRHRRHQHHPDGRLPGRRAARGRRLPRTGARHGRRRARPRPGRDPPPQLPPSRRLP